jgi:hypothetical protein
MDLAAGGAPVVLKRRAVNLPTKVRRTIFDYLFAIFSLMLKRLETLF